MKITTLGSGSKGNSLLLQTGEVRILIDAGLSYTDMLARLDAIFETPSSITAIVITHTHADHVRSVRRLSDSFKIPVYATEESFRAPNMKKVKRKTPIAMNERFKIRDIEFQPIPLSHDCDPTLAFTVEAEGRRFGIATDLGQVTDNLRRGFQGCHSMLIEFNHDRKMLEEGPYSFFLKQRVGGNLGHLSNDQAMDLLRSLLHSELKHLTLGHLSETNNRPDIAMECAEKVLRGEGLETVISVAPQHGVGMTVSV